MTHGIREAFAYRRRHEHGTQHPLDTLQTGSGTCRDYALLMIEALRQLGIAARFVSGYLFLAGDRVNGYLGGGSTHAWVQVYLPSEGWIEFDPTNGIVGSRDLIRVAVARDPRQAVPLHGVYLGAADAFREMEVNISVVSADQEPAEQEQAVEAQADRQPSGQEQMGQQQTDQAQTMSAVAEV
jgi:transglutaminase-like putative cysteine protease